MKSNPEFDAFNTAMDTILKANPQVVKSAMEQEKQERETERKTKREGTAQKE
jgi:hypothetical protein